MISRLARMIVLTLKYRDPAWISKGQTGWIHRYRDGVLVSPTLRSVPFRVARANTTDTFCWARRPQPGDVIVELGAEYGTETLFLARAVGSSGRVIAVEAHPVTCAVLRELVERNNLRNVTVVEAAVAGTSGSTTISDGVAVSNTTGKGELTVPALSLMDLLDMHGVQQVHMLKMNIEGAESSVLETLPVELAERITHAVISCHDFRADAGDGEFYRTGARVDHHLQRLGFRTSRRQGAAKTWIRDYRYADRWEFEG